MMDDVVAQIGNLSRRKLPTCATIIQHIRLDKIVLRFGRLLSQ